MLVFPTINEKEKRILDLLNMREDFLKDNNFEQNNDKVNHVKQHNQRRILYHIHMFQLVWSNSLHRKKTEVKVLD